MKRHKKDFRELSNKKCVECQRRLKQNLIDKNPDADICYNCKKEKQRQKAIDNYHASKLSKVLKLEPIDYLTVKAPETKEPIILSNFSRDAAGNLVKIH